MPSGTPLDRAIQNAMAIPDRSTREAILAVCRYLNEALAQSDDKVTRLQVNEDIPTVIAHNDLWIDPDARKILHFSSARDASQEFLEVGSAFVLMQVTAVGPPLTARECNAARTSAWGPNYTIQNVNARALVLNDGIFVSWKRDPLNGSIEAFTL